MEYIIMFCLVFLSAIFSGLTLGYFSLNRDDLERKSELGDWAAQKIYALRQKGNLLLTTLLIGNVAVNSALSIFLGSIMPGLVAGLAATGMIVLFGEILPQAIFARYALKFGSRLAWLVRIIRFILMPISWPIAWLLDRLLGDEMPTVYSKHELIKMIEDHEDLQNSEIDEDEERIIKGALSYSDKRVRDIMTPRTEMFALPHDEPMSSRIVKDISQTGHSRIPVYKENRDEIVGVLYTKDLIKHNWQDKTVGEVARKDVIFVDSDKKLDELLNSFKQTRHHLFVVMNQYGGVSGIVTVEDVIEEIIGEEIVDEFDKHEDLRKVAADKMKKRNINKI